LSCGLRLSMSERHEYNHIKHDDCHYKSLKLFGGDNAVNPGLPSVFWFLYLNFWFLFWNLWLKKNSESLAFSAIVYPKKEVFFSVEIINDNSIEEIQKEESSRDNKEAEINRPIKVIVPLSNLFGSKRIHSLKHNAKPSLSQRNLKHCRHSLKNIIEIRV